MTTPGAFESFTATVIPSQEYEVNIAKQPVLLGHGSEVRAILSQLPPDVSKQLLSDYQDPAPKLVASIEEAVISREMAIENAAQEVNLDQEWLNGAQSRKMSERSIGEEDPWNEPSF